MSLFPTTYPVTCHTGHVGQGSTFVAIKGYSVNGLTFIAQAIAQGATTIIIESADLQHITLVCRCPQFVPDMLSNVLLSCTQCSVAYHCVDNARQALAHESAAALDWPTKKLKIIGITGTKGKTSSSFITEHILRTAGFKTALLGGVYNKIGDVQEPSPLTTLGADDLQMFFAQCVAAGVEYVVMEVASHASSQHRVHGVAFNALGFTNFGQDHLDFYETMERYFEAKLAFFHHVKPGHALVINTDNDWSRQAVDYVRANQTLASLKLITFGQHGTSTNHVPFNIIQDSLDGLTVDVAGVQLIAPALSGEFNAYNVVMAAQLAAAVGVSWPTIAQAITTFRGTPGRLQLHRLANGARAFVDFAHNPSSFEAVLKALRPLTQHLIVLFGCGGNRDVLKRPLMGALAAQFADLVIVTDDNPRHEDRMAIINDILAGIPANRQALVVPDRKQAVKTAVALSTPGSVIALLGKGHEQYYLIGSQKIEYNDFEEIARY